MENTKKQLEIIGSGNIEEKLSLYDGYMSAILEINKSVNLTRIVDPAEFERRHFAESLLPCSDPVFGAASRIIDVGSGAGFPGVPMAIAFPEKEFVLLDSLAKRMDIVRGICADLGISNVTCIHGRAEDAAGDPELRESFDICVSRAVAELNVLSEYCLPFVRIGGTFLALKGKGYIEELDRAAKAIEVLGGEVDHITHEDENDPGSGAFIFIKKTEPTPGRYPRSAGKPSKKPIR